VGEGWDEGILNSYFPFIYLPLTPALSQWERAIKESLCDFHGNGNDSKHGNDICIFSQSNGLEIF
jgi:hypothetical protein